MNFGNTSGKSSSRSIMARLAALADEFAEAKSKGLGSDDLDEVAQAAAAGRVATLLIESDRQIAGRIDGTTGRVEVADLSDPRSR